MATDRATLATWLVSLLGLATLAVAWVRHALHNNGRMTKAAAKPAPQAPNKRPPNDRGQGRKPTAEGERRATSIRLSEDQHAKLARLGGAEWVRAQIDKAKEPK